MPWFYHVHARIYVFLARSARAAGNLNSPAGALAPVVCPSLTSLLLSAVRRSKFRRWGHGEASCL
jgi:hypothetical protein